MKKSEIISNIKEAQREIRDVTREIDMYDLDLARTLLTKMSLEEVYTDTIMELGLEREKLKEIKINWKKECSDLTGDKKNGQ